MNHRYWKTVVIVMVLCLALLTNILPQVGYGQSSGNKVSVNYIDVTAFPTLKAAVSVVNLEGIPVQGLGKDAFRLSEDGTDQPFTLVTETVGAVFAFLIDTSGSMAAESTSNATVSRLSQAKDLLINDNKGFLIKYMDPERRDKVSVIGFSSQLSPTLNLVDDYMAARNAVMPLSPEGGTKLFDALIQALNAFDRTSETERMRKILFILSDGDDTESAFKDMNEIARRANERGIQIHVITFGYYKNERPDSYVDKLSGRNDDFLVDKDLRSLALLTGGRYFRYNTATTRSIPEDRTPDEIVQFFQSVAKQRDQYMLTFSSKANTSGSHTIKVQVGEIVAEKTYTVNISTLKVDIINPPAGTSLPGGRLASDAHLQVRITFPDNRPRDLDRVEFVVDGNPASLPQLGVRDEAGGKVYEFAWPVRDLEHGDHGIKARAFDKLGVSGESVPVVLRVDVPWFERVLKWVINNLAIVLATIVVALVMIVTRGAPIRYGTRAVVSAYKSVTELFTPSGTEGSESRRGPKSARAFLRVVNGPNPGQEYPITDTYTKVGRDPEYAKIVIPERTVSRLHVTIEERQNGKYYVKDEGGTNRAMVDGDLLSVAEERILHSGAIIQLGAVKLEFVLPGADDKDKTQDLRGLPEDAETKTDVFTEPQSSVSSDETRPI